MKKFIDIHTHLAYELDDGAKSIDQSINMLRLAYEQGVQNFIATPHMSFRMKEYDVKEIRERTGRLLERARREISNQINIEVGQEVLFSKSSYEKIKAGKVQGLCGSKYLLLEFNLYDTWNIIYENTKRVLACGYIPVIAHVERYIFAHGSGKAEELLNLGALLQINLSSIVAGPWDFRQSFSRRLLMEKKVSFLGSDMHHDTYRKPAYEKALSWLENNLDEVYINQIFWENACDILGFKGEYNQ